MMLFAKATFLGIDPTAGDTPFTYAALDDSLRLLALGRGSLDDVAAYAAGQQACYSAVCAPRRPNTGCLSEPALRAALNPQPQPGRWHDFRLAEFLLRQRNLSIPQTLSDEAACPRWMRSGFHVFRRLDDLGYATYPAGESAPLQSLEVYPHAAYAVLLGVLPFPKNSLEGRLQRQLVLYDRRVDLPDPMDFFEEVTRHRLLHGILPLHDLFTPEELDALIAAYTAHQAVHQPQQMALVGDPDEGQITLPAPLDKSF